MRSLHHFSGNCEGKDPKNPEKVKCDGHTNRQTDGPTDVRTDGQTDRPTKRGVASRSTLLKKGSKDNPNLTDQHIQATKKATELYNICLWIKDLKKGVDIKKRSCITLNMATYRHKYIYIYMYTYIYIYVFKPICSHFGMYMYVCVFVDKYIYIGVIF